MNIIKNNISRQEIPKETKESPYYEFLKPFVENINNTNSIIHVLSTLLTNQKIIQNNQKINVKNFETVFNNFKEVEERLKFLESKN